MNSIPSIATGSIERKNFLERKKKWKPLPKPILTPEKEMKQLPKDPLIVIKEIEFDKRSFKERLEEAMYLVTGILDGKLSRKVFHRNIEKGLYLCTKSVKEKSKKR